MFLQPSLALTGGKVSTSAAAAARAGTFTANMRLPVHRWFRYSAGFSATWAQQVVADHRVPDGQWVFDPFAGSGTTLLAAQDAGVQAVGMEAHGFVARIAEAKLCRSYDAALFRNSAERLLAAAHRDTRVADAPNPLLARCYAPEALDRLTALRHAWYDGEADDDDARRLTWLAITAILRECSGVGTAQWQYLLPNKRKASVRDPFAAFAARVEMMVSDMAGATSGPPVHMIEGDARAAALPNDLAGQVGLVITSPPYPNNFDYADATRLEMTFWGEVTGWGDLHRVIRRGLVTSCSQHSAADKLDLDELLDEQAIEPIRDELAGVCRELAAVRETRGGRKTYHTMVAAYFRDLAKVWQALRVLCAEGSDLCLVIGDSAPYGVHVPVERWLATLAVAEGFRDPSFHKLRDRNVKWKNRKHRVPLHEGQLWLKG